MKKFKYIHAAAAVLILSCVSCSANAGNSSSPDIKDILGGAGGALGNMVEGIFTKTDLTVQDIEGTWTANGSAVSFKSDNMLKKAGGIAVAGAVESQLNEYYKKYGLNNLIFTVNSDNTFSLGLKKMTLKGTIEVKSKGIFTLHFTAFGTVGLGTMDTYVEKTGNNINLMFDADKIKNIISLAATLSGSKMASAADQLLKQYDGICLGFKMTKTGENQQSEPSAVDALKGLFKN